jgi:hypothetical protein
MVERLSSHQAKKVAMMATMKPPVQPEGVAEERRVHGRLVQLGADRVGGTRALECRNGQQVEHQVDGHIVEHDRHDHLMGTRLGLQQANEAAP